MADKKSNPQQIAQSVYEIESNSIKVRDATNLVPSEYNEILMSYTGVEPEPTQVQYLLNGTIVAVLDFTYDIRGRVTRVYRSV
jgi:hypothetical protein